MLNLNLVTFKRYKEACLKFAEDTKEWGELDEYRFYIANEHGEWGESYDNGELGISLKWAFHLSKSEIEERCLREYLDMLQTEIQFICDQELIKNGEWDAEESQEYLEWVSKMLSLN